MQALRWLYPGIGVKRWLVAMAAGLIMVVGGAVLVLGTGPVRVLALWLRHLMAGTGPWLAGRGVGLAIMVLGLAILALAVRGLLGVFLAGSQPRRAEAAADRLFDRWRLGNGPAMAALGGGTGLPVVLRGLKEYSSNLTAVVTVTDDGGSSGRLRGELGILPPGDIRNCLVALADTEPLMERLFQHRFDSGSLRGHSFGNLFIGAMTGITGDFEKAIWESSKVLAVRGQVLPSTLENVSLGAELVDGTVIRGESAITARGPQIRRIFLEPPGACAPAAVLAALRSARLLVIGPGSLYTSILPNLAVEGVAPAIRASGALKIFVINVMTQPGETDGYAGSDHVRTLLNLGGPGLVDIALLNTQEVPAAIRERYARDGAEPVVPDLDAVADLGVKPVGLHLLSGENLVRHDPVLLAQALVSLYLQLGVVRPSFLEQSLLQHALERRISVAGGQAT